MERRRLLRVYTWVASLLDTVNYPLALRTVVTPSSPNEDFVLAKLRGYIV